MVAIPGGIVRDTSIYAFGEYDLDLGAWRLRRSGAPVELEPRGVEVLALLIERAGEVVTKSEILDAVWKDSTVTENAMVRVIANLRSALGDDAREPRYVETVHTRGYRFIAPVERRGAAPVAASATVAAPPQERASRRHRAIAAAAVLVLVTAGVTALVAVRGRRAPGAGPPLAGRTMPSIAVLPLENLGPRDEQYFADGMTDAITTQLAKIEALKVIAHSAVRSYRDERPRPSVIARELGVATLVEGSALLAGGKVRITAHLVDCASDRQLWAESYEGDLSDVLALQARVARAIVAEVRVRVTPDEERRIAAAQPVNPAAYTEYLRGLASAASAATADAGFVPTKHAAIEHFDAALAIEPAWGEAHGRLADAYRSIAAMSDSHAERLRYSELARRSAERALELDPGVVSARRVLGMLLFVVDGDWAGAERQFLEALRLEPNSVDWAYGLFLKYAGRFDESYERYRHCQERSPTNPMLLYDTGCLFVCAGRLDEAEAQLAEFRARFAGDPDVVLLEAKILSRRGRYAAAADLLEAHRGALLTDRATTALQELSWASAKARQPERARHALRDREALGGRPDPSTLYALGDLAGVRRVIEERYRQHDYSLHYARCWPEYANLMRIPEVARVLREVGPPEQR